MGIATVAAVAAAERPIVTLAAVAAPPLNGRMAIAATFAGTVLRVEVIEGQSVKAGEKLALILSQDALRAETELRQAEAEYGAAAAAAKRTRLLAEEGIVAGARAEEAGAHAAQARAAVEEKRRLLSMAGERTGRPGEYVLTAPIAGRVAQLNLKPGEGIAAIATALVIDRTDRLWLEAKLPAARLGHIPDHAVAEAAGMRGHVVAVGSAIDPRTRSVVLRAEIPGGSSLIPGSPATLTILGPAPAGAVSLPRAAVLRSDSEDTVFIREADGYRAEKIRIEGYAAERMVVTGAVKAGDNVVVDGVGQLKALLEN